MSNLSKLIEEAKILNEGKQYVLFSRKLDDGTDGVFILNAALASCSVPMIEKYERRGWKVEFSTIKNHPKDKRLQRLFAKLSFVSVPRAEYLALKANTSAEIVQAELAAEVEKQSKKAPKKAVFGVGSDD